MLKIFCAWLIYAAAELWLTVCSAPAAPAAAPRPWGVDATVLCGSCEKDTRIEIAFGSNAFRCGCGAAFALGVVAHGPAYEAPA